MTTAEKIAATRAELAGTDADVTVDAYGYVVVTFADRRPGRTVTGHAADVAATETRERAGDHWVRN